LDQLSAVIIQHEGLILKPYTDTTGHITIGVGRNLSACGISESEAMLLLSHDITSAELELIQYFWFSKLDTVRQGVLIELTFNIGLKGVFGFEHMINALGVLDYSTASKALLNSAWAEQVGCSRANNMASRLLTGKY